MVNITVLVVDDELPFIQTLGRRLTRRKLNVLSAHSGSEALDVLENEKGIDVVILDVKMPGMDGIDTLRQIKAERPEIEVILLMVYGNFEIAVEAMRAGAFDCFMKPCSVEDLCARIVEAREKKRKREEFSAGRL